MRTQLFRTTPVLVNSPNVEVLLADMDGADPFMLFMENVDVAASLRTRYGSKNANLRFTAVTAGSAGNNIKVKINDVSAAPVSQAFAVGVAGSIITITLRTDAAGVPNMTADAVAERLNASGPVAALVRVTRALGSDGSGVFGLVGETDPVDVPAGFDKNLSGGFDAVTLGNVTVYRSPTGWPDFAGPWEATSVSAFDNLVAGAVVGVPLADQPMRGLRITASAGAYPTKIVVSAVARKKVV